MTNTEVREKLVELLSIYEYYYKSLFGETACKEFIDELAAHLIANGVTINVPQKPIENVFEAENVRIWNEIGFIGTTFHTCPKCGIRLYKTNDYCEKCGQHIDWSN